VRIQIAQARRSARELGFARLAVAEEHLPVQVRGIDGIELDDTDATDTGCREVHRERRAQATEPDQEHGGIFQLCLSVRPHFAQVEVSTVMREFAGREFVEGI
jgi:hypothetical protein